MKTRCVNEDEMKSVVETLIENTSLNKTTHSKKTVINENTNRETNANGKQSGWAGKLF
jgi:hypothetical protein